MFRRFMIMSRLMAPDNGAGGAGGGAGGAGGAPAGGGAFDEDAFMQKVAQMVQKALYSRDSQADKKREQDKADFKKMIDDALGARGGAPAGGDPPPDDGGKGGGKNKNGAAGDNGVAYQTLKTRLDEQEERSRSFEKKWQEERANRRQIGLNQRVLEALNAVGISGEHAEAARDSLLFRGRVGFADEESDEIVYRGDDGLASELALGLRQWAKTSSAQIYLPPSGVKGSGGRPGGNKPGAVPGQLTQEQRLAILADHFDRNIG